MALDQEINPVDDPVDSSSVSKPNENDTVAYASYKKLLDEKKKLSSKHSDVLARLADYESKEKELVERKLIEEKKYQELLESKEAALKEALTKVSSLTEEKTDYLKMHSFINALGDSKLESKYFSLVPLESIKLTEDGSVDQDTLNEVVNGFKAEHKRLLITTKSALPPTKVGSSSGKSLTPEEWRKLGTSKEMTERYKDVDWSVS